MTDPGAHSLVVDASVARAAGDTDGVALACREALTALLDTGLLLATSDALHDEWHRHRSRFSHKWLTQLYARKRVRKIDPVSRPVVRAAVVRLVAREREAAEKDLPLVETALAADQRILSRDDRARSIYARLSASVAELPPVLWTNPLWPTCCDWIRQGAPDEPGVRLAGPGP